MNFITKVDTGLSHIEVTSETCECGAYLHRSPKNGAYCPNCRIKPVTEPTRTKPWKETPEEAGFNAQLLAIQGVGGDASTRDSEARGQRELVESQSLPSATSFGDSVNPETDKPFIEIGIKFDTPFNDDPLFRPTTLPEGWTKAATGHDMWSHVLDERGRKRIAVFYKAAFYDRAARMSLMNRFVVSTQSSLRYDTENLREWDKLPPKDGDEDSIVIDRGAVPPVERFRQSVPPRASAGEDHEAQIALYGLRDKANEACNAWLVENYPDYLSPVAYWDEDVVS